jgi:hypothetical protein
MLMYLSGSHIGEFFYIFLSSFFCKIYGPQKNLQNYTSSVVGDGGRGPVYFCLNSDGGKLYIKIVAFDEIYNSVVQSFSI